MGQRPAGSRVCQRVWNACQCPACRALASIFPQADCQYQRRRRRDPSHVCRLPAHRPGQQSRKAGAHHGKCAPARYERQYLQHITPTLYAWLCSGRRWSSSIYQVLLSGFIAAPRAGRCCYFCQRLRQSCVVWAQQRLDERERPPVMECACGCRLAVTSCGLPGARVRPGCPGVTCCAGGAVRLRVRGPGTGRRR